MSHSRGENHWGAILKPENVIEIKQHYTPWVKSAQYFAQKFGVSKHTIRAIIYGQLWTHLDSDHVPPQHKPAPLHFMKQFEIEREFWRQLKGY